MIEKTTNLYYNKDYDYPVSRRINKKLYAKAIYENIADSPDELAFKKGDTLNVIEQDTDGLDGWWLCSLRGRQGICPGNRLRIISSYDSGCFSPSPSSSPCPSSLGASTVTLNSSILSTSDIYENSGFHSSGQLSLYSNDSGNSSNGGGSSIGGGNIYNNNINSNYNRQGKRRSWHTTPHKVITPQKCGDIYLYDILPLSSTNRNNSPYQNHYQNLSTIIMSSNMDPDTYDTPKPATPINCDIPKHPSWSSNLKSPNINNNNNNNKQNEATTPTTPRQQQQQQQINQQNDDSYDIPRPINLLHQQNMTPSSSNSSLSFSLSLSSSNRSSLANMPDYDIPRRNPIRQLTEQQHHQQQNNYDFPQPQTPQFIEKPPPSSLVIMTKELPLELSSALETLATLQIEGTSAVSRLLAFVTPNWRNREKLEPILMDIKLAAVRLKTALHDLTEFCDGALGNASRSDDKHLNLKLRPLVKALRDADKLIHDASNKIESDGWTVDNLARENQKNISHSPDSLDQMIACAQTLTEDVRQSASFIQGNASLLFKRIPSSTSVTTTPTTTTPISNNNSKDLTQDYDYVCFDTKETLSSAKLNTNNEMILLQNIKENRNLDKIELDNNDKLLVKYYALQISTHMGYLTQAIDSFLETVEKNQPPKFFIAYGKFVVLSAHNLVSIGDIVHRNINKNDLKQRIEQSTDSLADALKSCVIKSKKAAQHFPSVQAVQEMVDSVVDISHLASDLKISMLQAVHF